MIVDEQLRVAWEQVRERAEGIQRRRRRRLTAVTALGTVAALAGAAIVLVSRDPEPTRVAAGPDGDQRSIEGLPIPSLEPLYELAACRDTGDLRRFMVDQAASAATGEFSRIPMADAAQRAPVPRTVPPGAACALAGAMGQARGWEVRAADGALQARGLGAPGWDLSRLHFNEPGFVSARVASGQDFSGRASGTRIEGLAGGATMGGVVPEPGLAVVELPYLPASTATELLRQVSFAALTPLRPFEAFRRPTHVPDGFRQCTGDLYGVLLGEQPTLVGEPPRLDGNWSVTDYCDRSGAFLRYRTGGPRPAPTPSTVAVRELTGFVKRSSAQVSVAVEVPITPSQRGPQSITLAVEAEPGVATVEALAALLASVPLTDPHASRPRIGDHDLQRLFTPAWVASVLEAAGARDLRPEGPGFNFTLPGENGQTTSGVKLHDSTPPPFYSEPSEVISLASVDVIVVRGGGGVLAAVQFGCGRIDWTFVGGSAQLVQFAVDLINTLAC